MEGLNFKSFKDWALLGLISGATVILYSMKTSVEALNINVAVVVERTSNTIEAQKEQAEVQKDQERRIRSLEIRK